jgi:beta-xylosidase
VNPRWIVLLTSLVAGCSSDDAALAADQDGAPPPDAAATDSFAATDASPSDASPSPDVAEAASPPVVYTNPVIARDFADPFVYVEQPTYYAFATNAGGSNIQAASSTDLVHWTALPDALPTLPSWAASGLTWAPSVAKRAGTYVVYYTARNAAAGFQCISAATANAPSGPYVDASTAPLICQTAVCGSIDPSPFVDSAGNPYLVWKSDENAAACGTPPRLWSAHLSADGLSLVDPPVVLLTRDQAWEGAVIEGPSMVPASGRYLLFYSANDYASANYAIGYAVCDSPVGPCEKKTTDAAGGAWVRSSGAALGPGGQEFFTDTAGRPWMVYHAWTSPLTGYGSGGARSMRIDAVSFSAVAPTTTAPTTSQQTRE